MLWYNTMRMASILFWRGIYPGTSSWIVFYYVLTLTSNLLMTSLVLPLSINIIYLQKFCVVLQIQQLMKFIIALVFMHGIKNGEGVHDSSQSNSKCSFLYCWFIFVWRLDIWFSRENGCDLITWFNPTTLL